LALPGFPERALLNPVNLFSDEDPLFTKKGEEEQGRNLKVLKVDGSPINIA
jgi:hypothetical protein